MKRAKISVQTMLSARTLRRYGSYFDTFDLLQVRFVRNHPPENEYPVTFSQIDVFVRFFVWRHGTTRLNFHLFRITGDTETPVAEFGPYPADFPEGANVRDKSFRLPNVRVPLPGLYRIQLRQESPRRWDPEHFKVIGNDFIQVEAEK